MPNRIIKLNGEVNEVSQKSYNSIEEYNACKDIEPLNDKAKCKMNT